MRFFGIFGMGQQGKRTLSPEQVKNNEQLGEEKVDEMVAKQDAHYDAMTEEERDAYYVHPNLMTRIKKALRGE